MAHKNVFSEWGGVEVQKKIFKPPPSPPLSEAPMPMCMTYLYMYCSFNRYQGDCQEVEVDT